MRLRSRIVPHHTVRNNLKLRGVVGEQMSKADAPGRCDEWEGGESSSSLSLPLRTKSPHPPSHKGEPAMQGELASLVK